MQEDPRESLLYLVSPAVFEPSIFAGELDKALAASDGKTAGFLLDMPEPGDAELIAAAKALQPVCAIHNIAFFLVDRPELAVQINADGVLIKAHRQPLSDIRKIIGNDRVLGTLCKSRDEAMAKGDAGADYVAFERDCADLLAWWQEYFTLPCLALGNHTPEHASAMAIAGADFVAAGASIWSHGEGPAKATIEIVNALTEALQTR